MLQLSCSNVTGLLTTNYNCLFCSPFSQTKNSVLFSYSFGFNISEHSLKMSVVGVDVDGELVGEGGRRNVDGGAHL